MLFNTVNDRKFMNFDGVAYGFGCYYIIIIIIIVRNASLTLI